MTGHSSDLLRLTDFVLASLTMGASLRVLLRHGENQMSRYQMARFASLIVFVGTVMVTEVVRVHHNANWHTWADFVACLLGFYGVAGLLGLRHRHPKDTRL